MRTFADNTVLLFTPAESSSRPVAYIRNNPTQWCQWRGTDGSIVSDSQLETFWREGKLTELYSPVNQIPEISTPLDIGDGWVPMVTATLRAMRAIDPLVRIDQVKEKFGELRLYWSTDLDPEIDGIRIKMIEGLVEYAESRSSSICENCGKPGDLDQDNGWWRTLCTEDRAALRQRKAEAKKQQIDHSGHNHSATTEDRSYCRLTGDTGSTEESQA